MDKSLFQCFTCKKLVPARYFNAHTFWHWHQLPERALIDRFRDLAKTINGASAGGLTNDMIKRAVEGLRKVGKAEHQRHALNLQIVEAVAQSI